MSFKERCMNSIVYVPKKAEGKCLEKSGDGL